MKIPPKGASENLYLTIIAGMLIILIIICLFVWGVMCPNKSTGDFALTDKEILVKAQQCHKLDMVIRLVYDEEWNVYAVKCIEGGFTGSGVKKKK
jgi:hypothetical protein